MKYKKNDSMIGRIFGKWTVLEYDPDRKPGKHYECLCTCGTIAIKAGTVLRAFRSTQCRRCGYDEIADPDREIGRKYGKWTIIKFLGIHRKLQQYECRCRCGFIGKHCAADLRSKKSKQCTTCHNRENAQFNLKHGRHNTKVYKIWQAMLYRCRNPKATPYKWYGGRGISVCKEWYDFKKFFEDMGEPPEKLTLDRINNDGNYCKKNCRWVTHKENCRNRRKTYSSKKTPNPKT